MSVPRSIFCPPGLASVSHHSLAKHPLDTRVPPSPLATQSSLGNREGPHPPVIWGGGDIECQRRHNRLSLSLQLSLDLYSRRHRMASHGRSGQNTLEGHPARKKLGWDRSRDHLGLGEKGWMVVARVVGVRKASSHVAHRLTGGLCFSCFSESSLPLHTLRLK